MYTLHTWTTPNGRKPLILLEELGLSYDVVPVNLHEGAQFKPDFLAISPNNKIPALQDSSATGGPLALFESGAILTYLAEKHEDFLPAGGLARYHTLQWLYWQVGGLGPMLGQLGFFARQEAPLARAHFAGEVERLLTVLEGALVRHRFVAGEQYTIADIACYPWAHAATSQQEVLGEVLANKPALQRWLAQVGARPAVARAMAWQPAP